MPSHTHSNPRAKGKAEYVKWASELVVVVGPRVILGAEVPGDDLVDAEIKGLFCVSTPLHRIFPSAFYESQHSSAAEAAPNETECPG